MTQFNVKIEGLCLKKGYKLLIHNLNFTCQGGQIIALSGQNGVGKTTLLRAICGFLRPDEGKIDFYDGQAQIDSENSHSNHIHYLGHQEALSPTRTALQELKFQSDFLLSSSNSLLEKAVARLNLGPFLNLETRYLSAGQKRRLSLARLIITSRPLWLLDEPMAPLDLEHRNILADLMQDHVKSNGLIICAVHDPLPFATEPLHLTRPDFEAKYA